MNKHRTRFGKVWFFITRFKDFSHVAWTSKIRCQEDTSTSQPSRRNSGETNVQPLGTGNFHIGIEINGDLGWDSGWNGLQQGKQMRWMWWGLVFGGYPSSHQSSWSSSSSSSWLIGKPVQRSVYFPSLGHFPLNQVTIMQRCNHSQVRSEKTWLFSLFRGLYNSFIQGFYIASHEISIPSNQA